MFFNWTSLSPPKCRYQTHLAELAVGRLVLFRRIDNDVHGCLSRNRRAETDGQKLDELGLHLGVHVQHLHVASTEATPGCQDDTAETPSCLCHYINKELLHICVSTLAAGVTSTTWKISRCESRLSQKTKHTHTQKVHKVPTSLDFETLCTRWSVSQRYKYNKSEITTECVY